MGGRGASSGKGGSGGGILGNPREQRDDYTQAEYNALQKYTQSSSINGRLGTVGVEGLDEYDKKYVANLDSALAKSGFNKTMDNTPFLRGGGGIMIGVPTDMSFSSPQELADYINNNSVGNVFKNVGYTSITTTPGVAASFASGQTNGIILHYNRIYEGMKGGYVSGGKGKKAISVYGTHEDETLLQRNVHFIPLQAVVKGGQVHVSVIAAPKKSTLTKLWSNIPKS